MSASNGGRGAPPVPPEGHGPQPPQREPRQVIECPVGTSASRIEGERGLMLTFVTVEAGEPVKRTFLVGENGEGAIRDAVTGGIQIAGADEMPVAK
ncbi:MAG TPA: hypothetical protein VFI09_07095 [Solirubrobacterales bacterium]|nr:hypothetical protein [Solirubrobacterales bacterium]